MPWVKIDDQFSNHPKIMQAGPLAGWLHVCALCYCARYLTDGFVPNAVTNVLANYDHIGVTTATTGIASIGHDIEPAELVDALVDAGMWEVAENGFQIHDYLEYNPSKVEVLEERAKNAARQGRYQANRKHNAVTNTVTNDTKNASVTGAPYPYPVLSKESAQAHTRTRKARPEKEPNPERKNQIYAVAQAIADVCHKDIKVRNNTGRFCKTAADLLDGTIPATPELVREHYNGGGWWWRSDWRGLKNQLPTPDSIEDTWGQWAAVIPEVVPYAAEVWG